MRKVFILAALLVAGVVLALPTPTSQKPSVTIAWDQHSDTNVTGYMLYWGTASRTYTNSITVNGISNTSCAVSNLVRGVTYYFAATAFVEVGLESDYSVEVSYTTREIPLAPRNPRAATKQW